MALVTGITLPNNGDRIKAENYNDPINKILAQVNGNIDSANLVDGGISSSKFAPGAVQEALNLPTNSSPDWTPLGTLPTVTANGQGSYSLVFSAVNYTDRLSPGKRIMTQRSIAAPTQSTSLNGTTQYWSKSSPNKLTFTDDFTVSAWVKLNQYGAYSVIASRYNGTSGWRLAINDIGRIELTGNNGSSANFSLVTSLQSIPLNKWVHVAAQLDMSAFTATTTTSYVMINGVNAQAAVTRGGTNPTSLVQAGNLEIGSQNGGTSPLPGKVAQVVIFNAKVAQATMLGYMSQGMTGSETSVASAYSFNGVFTDLNTTTPNDLTANGSATATNADSPFGGQASGLISSTLDYSLVTSVTFSTNTTVVVQVPEGCTIPTTGGLAAISYSAYKAPLGFPTMRRKWFIETIIRYLAGQTTPTQNVWYNIEGIRIVVPIGDWNLQYQAPAYANRPSGPNSIKTTVSTSTSAELERKFTAITEASATTDLTTPVNIEDDVNVSVQTPYYFLMRTDTTSVGVMYVLADRARFVLSALPAYL